jgi:hypothetical protein
MTGYTVHTGTSKKFVEGWDRVFGGNGRRSEPAAGSSTAATPKKKAGKKRRGKS